MLLLLEALNNSSEKALAFVSIGKLATALQDKFDPSYISQIMKAIVYTLDAKKYLLYYYFIFIFFFSFSCCCCCSFSYSFYSSSYYYYIDDLHHKH